MGARRSTETETGYQRKSCKCGRDEAMTSSRSEGAGGRERGESRRRGGRTAHHRRGGREKEMEDAERKQNSGGGQDEVSRIEVRGQRGRIGAGQP